MNTAERAALEHENWIAYLTGVVRCTNAGRVHRDGGAVSIGSDIPFDWFNQVLIERPDATPLGLLAVLEDGIGRGRGLVVRLRGGADDRFISMLTRMGLVAAGEATTVPGMVAFPIDGDVLADAVAPSRLPGFEIRQVTDAIGIGDHRKVVTVGFRVTASGCTRDHMREAPRPPELHHVRWLRWRHSGRLGAGLTHRADDRGLRDRNDTGGPEERLRRGAYSSRRDGRIGGWLRRSGAPGERTGSTDLRAPGFPSCRSLSGLQRLDGPRRMAD